MYKNGASRASHSFPHTTSLFPSTPFVYLFLCSRLFTTCLFPFTQRMGLGPISPVPTGRYDMTLSLTLHRMPPYSHQTPCARESASQRSTGSISSSTNTVPRSRDHGRMFLGPRSSPWYLCQGRPPSGLDFISPLQKTQRISTTLHSMAIQNPARTSAWDATSSPHMMFRGPPRTPPPRTLFPSHRCLLSRPLLHLLPQSSLSLLYRDISRHRLASGTFAMRERIIAGRRAP